MQANSQRSGQNFHGKGATPQDGASNALGKNIYQQRVPSHSASSSHPGQSATGSYLTQFTCTIPPASSDQILTSSVQANKDAKDNQFKSICTLPAGQQDSQFILWEMLPSCQIFIPVNNINIQGTPVNNGPRMSNSAFNSNNTLYMQQQSTSLAAGPNNSQQGKAKTMGTKSPNEAGKNVNTSNLNSRQHPANAPTNLPKEPLKIKLSLPSNLQYCPPTENAPHNHSSLFYGYNNSTHANMPALSTCVQNIAAQRAVAVVTPLSPIGMTPVNVSDNSANMKMNLRPVQEINHQPNTPHPLGTSDNLMNQTEEPNAPTSEHQQSKSAELRLNDGLCSAIQAIVPDESTSRSLPKVISGVVEPETSTQIQIELRERVKNNCTITETKVGETDTIPVIEWPLDRLHTLIRQIEVGTQQNLQKNDAGKDILRLYWNGDVGVFRDAVHTGIYQNIMEEVFVYSPMEEPVILRQMLNDARNKATKDFHILKHDEEPPKMTHTSSWLNLNENVDDIDKECGYSWFYKHFTTEHEAEDFASKTPSKLQAAAEKPSRFKLFPKDVDNKEPAKEPTVNNESLHENLPVSLNAQSPPVKDTKKQTLSESNCTNSLEATITVAEDQDVLTGTSFWDHRYCSEVGSKGEVPKTNSPKLNHLAAEEEVVLSEMKMGCSEKMPNSDCAVLDKNVRCETLAKPSQELALNAEEETDTVKEKITARSPDKNETSLLKSPQDLGATSSVEQKCRKRSQKLNVKELSSCQPSTVSPLKAMTKLVRILKNRDVPLKYKNLFAKHNSLKIKAQYSSATSHRKNNLRNGVRDKIDKKSDCANPPVLSPEAEVPQEFLPVQNESDEMMIHSDSDITARCEADSKPGQELEEKGVDMDVSASIKIHSLSPEMAKQCYAGQLMDDKHIAASKEMAHKVSSLCRPIVLDITNEQTSMGSLEKTIDNCSPKDNVVAEQTSCQSNTVFPTVKSELDERFGIGTTSPDADMDVSASFMIHVLPHEVAKQCFAGQPIEDISAPPEMIHKPALLKSFQDTMSLSMGMLEETNDNCSTKENVVAEQTNCQSNTLNAKKNLVRAVEKSESSEEFSDTDCLIIDENVNCEIDPREELPVNTNKMETEKVDVLDFIKIDVLPHEMAELWFAGGMESTDLKKESDVHISTEDQIQNVEVKLKKEVLEDVTTKERKYQSSDYEKLDSFCCLGKWFQMLEYGSDVMCSCQKSLKLHEKEIQIEDHNKRLKIESENENPREGQMAELQNSDSENTEDETPLPSNAVVGISSPEKVCRLETETSEPARDESPSKCETNETLTHNEIEQVSTDPDLKMATSKICLSLYGSSSERKKEEIPTKRYKEAESCEEPPETIQVTIKSQQIIKRKRKSNKCKGVESENDDAVESRERVKRACVKNQPWRRSLPSHPFSELGKNALSSTSIGKLFSPQSDSHSGNGNKRKRQQKDSTQQMSMNKFVIRKTMPSKLLHSPEKAPKSKYELGNPALMPLQDGVLLEFKVLPESFNFEDGAEPDCIQDDVPSGMSASEDKSKRMKTGCSSIQGVWSFSPLKKRHSQATDVSGPCSLFQEFKKRYHEKKDVASKKNLNSS